MKILHYSRTIFFLLLTLGFFGVSLSSLRAQTTYPGHSLIEEITGTSSGYGPLGAWYSDSLHAHQPANAIIISWHQTKTGVLGDGSDNMTIQAGLDLSSAFSAPSLVFGPSIFIGRRHQVGFDLDVRPNGDLEVKFDNKSGIAKLSSVLSMIEPDVDLRLVNVAFSGSTLNFDIDVTPGDPDAMPSEDTTQYSLLAVLTENKVVAPQFSSGLDGKPDSTILTDFVHNNVARLAISKVLGDHINLKLSDLFMVYPLRTHYSIDVNPAWNDTNIVLKVALIGTSHGADSVFDATQSDYLSTYIPIPPSLVWIAQPRASSVLSNASPIVISWARSGGTGPNVRLQYSLDSGATWKLIVATTDLPQYSWPIPKSSYSKRAQIRVTDAADSTITGLSEIFTMPDAPPAPSLAIVRPAETEVIPGGKTYPLTLKEALLTMPVRFEYSFDGGQTWDSAGPPMTTESNKYYWSVENDSSVEIVLLRGTDHNGVTAISGLFSIEMTTGVGSLSIIKPTAGEVVEPGKTYDIALKGEYLTPPITMDYSLDGGTSWQSAGAPMTKVASTYAWPIDSGASSNNALVRATDSKSVTATSSKFKIGTATTIDASITNVKVQGLDPNNQIGTNIPTTISWQTTGNVGSGLIVQYSENNQTWTTIAGGSVAASVTSTPWTTTATDVPTAYIKVISADADKPNLVGFFGPFAISTSTGQFGKITDVMVQGLDLNDRIPSNTPTTITWKTEGNIGSGLIVEYSNNNDTWAVVANGTLAPTATSVSWTTTPTDVPRAYVRVRSADNDLPDIVDKFGPFKIGTVQGSVTASHPILQSLTNYPNPLSAETTINFNLSSACAVTLIVTDELGREVKRVRSQHLDAGAHTIELNAAGLTAGTYTYLIKTNSATLVGKMNVVR